MSEVIIKPNELCGEIVIPSSKSLTHRSIICGCLAGKRCKITPISFSQDILATIQAMKNIGSEFFLEGENLFVEGFSLNDQKDIVIDCCESASTLRFLIPIVSALGINASFKMSESLAKRPLLSYLRILSKNGLKFQYQGKCVVKISGKLTPGTFCIPGGTSSQFISGLLLALPLLEDDSLIEITSKLKSANYVSMTTQVMRHFGVRAQRTQTGFFIAGNQKYKPADYTIEGDWSQAAFFLAAGLLRGRVSIKGLNTRSIQGDSSIYSLISDFGGKIYTRRGAVVTRKSDLHGITIDASQIPDLVPILTVLAANAEGMTVINNIRRLRFKESSRAEVISEELGKLGVEIYRTKHQLKIIGNQKLHSEVLWGHNDHRIVMALSIMANVVPEGLKIKGAESINKSYPDFFKDYALLGGNVNVVHMGSKY